MTTEKFKEIYDAKHFLHWLACQVSTPIPYQIEMDLVFDGFTFHKLLPKSFQQPVECKHYPVIPLTRSLTCKRCIVKQKMLYIMSINQIKYYSEYLIGEIDFTQHPKHILLDLVLLSKEYGKPLYFTSSFRTPHQNQVCGGSPTSSHLKGLAFDIKCTNSIDRWKLIQAINSFGIKRYGVYKNFIHVDFDSSKPQNVTWYG